MFCKTDDTDQESRGNWQLKRVAYGEALSLINFERGDGKRDEYAFEYHAAGWRKGFAIILNQINGRYCAQIKLFKCDYFFALIISFEID